MNMKHDQLDEYVGDCVSAMCLFSWLHFKSREKATTMESVHISCIPFISIQYREINGQEYSIYSHSIIITDIM